MAKKPEMRGRVSPTELKIVAVAWLDPTSHVDWVGGEEANAAKSAHVVSVGILLGEDEEHVRLAMDADDEGGWNTRGTIPKTHILRRKEFKLPKVLWTKPRRKKKDDGPKDEGGDAV